MGGGFRGEIPELEMKGSEELVIHFFLSKIGRKHGNCEARSGSTSLNNFSLGLSQFIGSCADLETELPNSASS